MRLLENVTATTGQTVIACRLGEMIFDENQDVAYSDDED